jgi:hypothetical protein
MRGSYLLLIPEESGDFSGRGCGGRMAGCKFCRGTLERECKSRINVVCVEEELFITMGLIPGGW